MKKSLLTCIMVMPLLLFSQNNGIEEKPRTVFTYNGNAGYVTMGSVTYSQIRFMPELQYGKFGMGLDLDLLITSDINIRKSDWDEPEDMISKIYYVKYAEPGDPFYFRLDAFPDYSVGHGLIMSHYNNRLLYPDQKNLGGAVGINTILPLQPSAEVFSSNLAKNNILAAQAYCKPFTISETPAFANLRFGVMAATDRNQFGKYEDTDGDKVPDILDPNPKRKNYPNDLDGDGIPNWYDLDMDGDNILDSPYVNSYVASIYPELSDSTVALLLDNDIPPLRRYSEADEVSIYGVSYDMPLINTGAFTLGHYGEYAKIDGYGSGVIFPGFSSQFLIFDLNLELRKFENMFIPSYFDHLYDEQRSYVIQDTVITTKDKSLETVKSSFGWFGGLQADIADKVIVSVSYQDMYGKGNTAGKSVVAKIGFDPVFIHRITEASIMYTQSNVPYISLKNLQTPSASIDGIVSYRLSDRTLLTGRYAERYVDFDGNQKINGSDEIIKSMSLIVEFQF